MGGFTRAGVGALWVMAVGCVGVSGPFPATGDAGATVPTTDAGASDNSDAGRPHTDSGMPTDSGTVADSGTKADAGPPFQLGDAGRFPLGWSALPGTAFTPVCQPAESFFSFGADCRMVIEAWSGGVADTKRNRLIVWGGGHNDYYGNEVYALNLVEGTMTRLNDPTALTSPSDCVSMLSDGKPTSRHTYGGLSYLPDQDQMVLFGGVASCPAGGFQADVWLLDFAGLAATPNSPSIWQRVIDPIPNLPYGGILGASDRDPVSGLIYLYTASGVLLSFDPASKAITKLKEAGTGGYHYTGVIDPLRREFFLVGGGFAISFSLDTGNAYQDITTQMTGCDALISNDYPGLAFDDTRNRIVGWVGGSEVVLVDLATKSCSTVTGLPGHAPGAARGNGTNGRFRLFPGLHVFALVNDPDDNAYILNLGTP